ncbi:type II secretion system secretin GspD [Sulfuricaulis sp.]|jgi:general secretion pathway protein D|uniref:type II secretion system secretin GspD n=1 Tax=Sulfuricaulis sp. TaxID=2003553 RepID=UPI00355A11EB
MTDTRHFIATTLGTLMVGALLVFPLAQAAELKPIQVAQAPSEDDEPNAPQSAAVTPPVPPGGVVASPPMPPQGARTIPSVPPSFPAAPAPARPATAAGTTLRPGQMMFNFQEADIQAVVKTVSQITGKNFLLDPRVKGKLTIISTQPVSKNAIYQIFLASLKAQGYTAIDSASGFIKLVPLGDAKQAAVVTTGVAPRPGEQTITHVVTVQHGSAAQIVPLLRPLMAPTSQLSVYPPANTLIITDYADNIRNLLHIVEILDQRGGSELTIVPLKNASALDIAEIIVRLYPNVTQSAGPVAPVAAGVGEADRVTIMPDLRTNSLLVRAENPGTINDLRALIEKLDVPAKVSGNTRVVYLRNAEATKLAEILRGLLSGEARALTASAAATPGRPPVGASKAAEASQIQADEATNSLVISASDAVFNNLRAVIEKLDIRRAQVYVEALIVEITTDKASQFGFQWAGGKQVGSGTAGALINFPAANPGIVTAALNPQALAATGGLSIAYVGKKITLSDGSTVTSLGALATALESNNIANVLSMPNMLTLDNAEAKIVVGQNVPFVTGSYASATTATGTVNPFQTVERKDVGLTLKIKPQISEGGGIKMQIYEEASSVANAASLVTQDLITNKRSLETTVIVDDGSTIVLGGLIEDNNQQTTQQVPFLGRIPLLGWLFKYQTQDKKKTNLMVFLRPLIVRAPDDSYGFTANRYEHIRATEKSVTKEKSPILERFLPTVPAPDEKQKPATDEIPPDKIFGPPNLLDAKPGTDGASP